MSSEQQKILVIKLGALGDFIQALGPMKAIRKHHPDAHITLLTTKPFKNFAEKSSYFDDIWLDARPKFYQPLKWLSLGKKLNAGKFTRVYDLQNNDRTSIYFKLFSPKPEWSGAVKGASLQNANPDRSKGLAFYGHKETLAIAGINTVEIDTLDWIKTDISFFNLKRPYALIVAGCAPTRPEKRWPTEHFIALCNHLISQEIQVVLLGTDSEKDITKQIHDGCPQALNLTGKTSLFDLAALGRKAQIAIGNDTGPMHIIAPTGCKTLVLFSGHSKPIKHAPLGTQVSTLQENDLEDLKPKKVIKEVSILLEQV